MFAKKHSPLLSILLIAIFITSGFSLCLAHYSDGHHETQSETIALEAQLQQSCCSAETNIKQSTYTTVALEAQASRLPATTLAVSTPGQSIISLPAFFRPPGRWDTPTTNSQAALMVFRC